jgi:hypothetical protein
MQLTIDASHPIEFQIMAGSPAARETAQGIIDEIQAAQRVNTIEAATSHVNPHTFDASKGGLQIVGMDARSQAILNQEGMYKGTGVSDKLEMGEHTAKLNLSGANNIVFAGSLASRPTTGGITR